MKAFFVIPYSPLNWDKRTDKYASCFSSPGRIVYARDQEQAADFAARKDGPASFNKDRHYLIFPLSSAQYLTVHTENPTITRHKGEPIHRLLSGAHQTARQQLERRINRRRNT